MLLHVNRFYYKCRQLPNATCQQKNLDRNPDDDDDDDPFPSFRFTTRPQHCLCRRLLQAGWVPRAIPLFLSSIALHSFVVLFSCPPELFGSICGLCTVSLATQIAPRCKRRRGRNTNLGQNVRQLHTIRTLRTGRHYRHQVQEGLRWGRLLKSKPACRRPRRGFIVNSERRAASPRPRNRHARLRGTSKSNRCPGPASLRPQQKPSHTYKHDAAKGGCFERTAAQV